MRENMIIGDRAETKKAFSEADVRQFAILSTDDNPLHLDPEFAKTTIFGQRIVHGALVSSLISGLLGRELPGYGAIYLGQTYAFKKPIYLDEEITAYVEIVNIRQDKPIMTLKTVCLNSKGEVAIEGEATVRV